MTERAFHIAGWVLFIFSAFGFIASSAASGDAAGLTRRGPLPDRLLRLPRPPRSKARTQRNGLIKVLPKGGAKSVNA